MKLIYSTFADERQAQKVAKRLITDNLCVCANVLGEGISLYSYKQKVVEDYEVYTIFKTTDDKIEAMIKKLEQIHPYEVPAIIQIDAKAAGEKYAEWLGKT